MSVQMKPGMPTCQVCGGAMKKDKRSHGNLVGIVLALIVFCVGIAIFVFIPCFGWVIGPIVCVLALFMGGKREKIWKCTLCGAFVMRG